MSNPSPKANQTEHETKESLDEIIVKKKSFPAQIVLWLVILVLLFLTYAALSGYRGR